uniref:Odorant binding protein 6 n=1 Tax=Sirex nitobei TaxID=1602346 RepID=A0A857N4Z6_9HYME|nr:odorant binding protein 6 [Sirex nitobei]
MAKIIHLVITLFFLTTFVFGGAIPDDMKAFAKALRDICIAESGTMKEYIEKASKGEFTNDEKLKCYFKCLFEKLDLITEAGELDYEKMMDFAPKFLKQSAMKMIENCRSTTGTDLCDTAFKVNKCFQKTDPTTYFVI